MTLTLIRRNFRPDGIFSDLMTEDGRLMAKCLEHSFDGKPKVYDGTFTCVKGTHQLDHEGPFTTFEITGVQGHSGILFHVGNYNKDSDGCVLLGEDIVKSDVVPWMITKSKIQFDDFMTIMGDLTEFMLKVITP